MGWPKRKWFTQVKEGKTGKKLKKKYCGKVEETGDLIPNTCNMEVLLAYEEQYMQLTISRQEQLISYQTDVDEIEFKRLERLTDPKTALLRDVA